jgi:hypothetical protein
MTGRSRVESALRRRGADCDACFPLVDVVYAGLARLPPWGPGGHDKR